MDAPTYCMRPLLANFPNTREVITLASVLHTCSAQCPRFPAKTTYQIYGPRWSPKENQIERLLRYGRPPFYDRLDVRSKYCSAPPLYPRSWPFSTVGLTKAPTMAHQLSCPFLDASFPISRTSFSLLRIYSFPFFFYRLVLYYSVICGDIFVC